MSSGRDSNDYVVFEDTQDEREEQNRESGDSNAHPTTPSSTYSHRLVYTSFMLSSFGDRMWEFSVIVFLLDLFPDTLLLASLFGLLENVAGIAAGPEIGRYIDRTDRLTTLRVAIAGQNISIAAASILFAVGIAYVSSLHSSYLYIVYTVIVICGMIAKCAGTMSKVALQKDWLVVLAGGDSTLQTTLNGSMRRIDLTCSIVAPLAVGLIATFANNVAAVTFVIVWSAVSFFIELRLIQWVYDNITALHHKPNSATKPAAADATEAQSAPRVPIRTLTYRESLITYYHHPIFIPSVAYCLLYVSLLNFGGIFTSYLKTRQLSDAALAGGRAAAAIVGIGSTITLPFFIHRVFHHSITKTGMVALWSQLLCLVPTILVFFILPASDDLLFTVIVFISICLSRFGLWSFDLIETQMLQEMIHPTQAGVINGVQESLMNVMYLLGFVLTIVFYDPDLFVWPTCISFACVALSTLLFTWYVYFGSPQPSIAKSDEEVIRPI